MIEDLMRVGNWSVLIFGSFTKRGLCDLGGAEYGVGVGGRGIEFEEEGVRGVGVKRVVGL